MDIGVPLRDLGEVDAERLRRAILAAPAAAWLANQYRQQTYDAHYRTHSLVMLFTDCRNWPHAKVTREPGWALLADPALALMDDLISRHYEPGGLVIRAMAAKLEPGAVVKPHFDAHPSFCAGHRIHVPITTNPLVRLHIGGQPHRLAAGRAYEINNQRRHSVMNKGRDDRITFIFDYVPADRRADLDLVAPEAERHERGAPS